MANAASSLIASGVISFKHLSKSTITFPMVCHTYILADFISRVTPDASEDHKYHLNSKIVNRRGIYKDVFGSGAGREWSDYQLRPNYPIAMTVAPELFNPEHALAALKLADKALGGPLGMATLDPSDLQYRPFYDNANDGDDASIAKGLNYHQVSSSPYVLDRRLTMTSGT